MAVRRHVVSESERCRWPGCGQAYGPTYLGRPLCSYHFEFVMRDGAPRQFVSEALDVPLLTAKDAALYRGVSYHDRETRVKGAACQGCKKNVPDSEKGAEVWCWRCLMAGKGRPKEEPVKQEEAETSTSGGRGAADEIVQAAASGVTSYTGNGGTITQGKEPDSVAVSDAKGVTTYKIKDATHLRILTARVQRWLRKGALQSKPGTVPVKGPKLEVRLKEA